MSGASSPTASLALPSLTAAVTHCGRHSLRQSLIVVVASLPPDCLACDDFCRSANISADTSVLQYVKTVTKVICTSVKIRELVSGTNQLKQTEFNLCNALPAAELLKFNRGCFLKGGAQGERGKQGKEQNEQNVNFKRFFAICRLGTCKTKELMI